MSNGYGGRGAEASAKTAAVSRASVVEDVFDGLPYGVVITDGDGVVVEANPEAASLLLAGGELPGHCGDLFSCRAPGGPCAKGCLVRQAVYAGEALPEVRTDTNSGGRATAVWATAAPLAAGTGALLHLREGHAQDRRRRSDPDWFTGPRVRVKSLGRTSVDSADAPADQRWLGRRPGQLLKFLVTQRERVVHAEEVAEALWPEARNGPGNVRFTVHALRKLLEPNRAKGSNNSFLVAVAEGYMLDREQVAIDADAFEAAVHAGVAEFTQGDEERAEEQLDRAVALYGGDFFEEDRYTEWVQLERERLRGLYLRALHLLARIEVARGQLESALGHLERLGELEPFDSDIARELIDVLLRLGRRGRARRHYGQFRRRVWREFQQTPDFQLSDLGGPTLWLPEANASSAGETGASRPG